MKMEQANPTISVNLTEAELYQIANYLPDTGAVCSLRNRIFSEIENLKEKKAFQKFSDLISQLGIIEANCSIDSNELTFENGEYGIDSQLECYSEHGSYPQISFILSGLARKLNVNSDNCFVCSGFQVNGYDEYDPYMLMVIADENHPYNGLSFYHTPSTRHLGRNQDAVNGYFVWKITRNDKRHTHNVGNFYNVIDEINRIAKIEA
jgi:hypothetical protein